MGAAAIAGAPRSDPSRSLAEAAALEAALRAGCDGHGDGPRDQAIRRIPVCQRHRRLLRLDAVTPVALTGFCLAGGARRRLAATMGRLHHDALRPEGRARGTRGGVFAIQTRWLTTAPPSSPSSRRW